MKSIRGIGIIQSKSKYHASISHCKFKSSKQTTWEIGIGDIADNPLSSLLFLFQCSVIDGCVP